MGSAKAERAESLSLAVRSTEVQQNLITHIYPSQTVHTKQWQDGRPALARRGAGTGAEPRLVTAVVSSAWYSMLVGSAGDSCMKVGVHVTAAPSARGRGGKGGEGGGRRGRRGDGRIYSSSGVGVQHVQVSFAPRTTPHSLTRRARVRVPSLSDIRERFASGV